MKNRLFAKLVVALLYVEVPPTPLLTLVAGLESAFLDAR